MYEKQVAFSHELSAEPGWGQQGDEVLDMKVMEYACEIRN